MEDVLRRLRILEEMYHKQSIIQSANEIVTTASLQNYLDALTGHIQRQFDEKVRTHTEQIEKMLAKQSEEVSQMLKDKGNKHKIERQITHINEMVRNN